MSKLFKELKRRNVVRVGIAYVVLSWVVLQVGDVLFDMFGTPEWVGKTLAVLLALGFPFACLFAWAFEMTPEGIKKTAEVDASDSITHSTGRKLNFVIIAALVVALGYFIWERQGLVEPGVESAEATDRSIAVLPFVNMSSDEEQEWFADGLTEEILNALARTPDLLVASRTSSFQYKNQNTDISDIAKALGVAHVLEGSVRRGGDRLRVTAQLIRASDGFHLWSETFDRTPEDVITIQEDVAFEIANALETAMDPEALKAMVSSGTASVAAYESYLEGLALEGNTGSSGNVENWAVANAAYVRARTLDPSFALAWWSEAIYWGSQMDLTDIGSDREGLQGDAAFQNYLAAIDEAISHARSPELAYLYRANKAARELRFADSIRLAERYMEYFPNDTEALVELVSGLATVRDIEGGKRHVARLAAISRDDPLLLNALINNLLFLDLVDEVVEVARDAIRDHSEHSYLVYQSHRALLWAGHVDEGGALVGAVERSEFPEVNKYLVRLRQACAEGDVARAQALVERYEASQPFDLSISFIMRQIMGEPEAAHQLLVEADLDLHSLRSFMNYPFFDHTHFPAMVETLERQGIDRPYIESPPYACKIE